MIFLELTYHAENENLTIRNVVKNKFNISSRLLTKLRKNNKILLNGKSTYLDKPMVKNDVLNINLDFEEDNSNILPKAMSLEILFEDDCFLILNKPSNIAVHPSILHYDNSLSNGVKNYFDSINLKRKIRPVNRLDRDTSGIIIFAKNEYIQESLISQMKSNTFYKEYLAILDGNLEKKTGTINAPISRKEDSIIERCISETGSLAITEYSVIKDFENYCLVKFILKTGRTHQIRVHTKYIGHPILGDTLYGTPSQLISRQALHSNKVEFIHPLTGKSISLEVNPPSDMLNLL